MGVFTKFCVNSSIQVHDVKEN